MTSRDFVKKMILYILLRVSRNGMSNDERLTKLCNTLFEADFTGDIVESSPISSHPYIIADGMPAPQDYAAILDEMRVAGDIADVLVGGVENDEDPPVIVGGTLTTLAQVEFVDYIVFTSQQSHYIDSAIANNFNMQSFSLTGWESVPEGNPVPYGTVSFA